MKLKENSVINVNDEVYIVTHILKNEHKVLAVDKENYEWLIDLRI